MDMPLKQFIVISLVAGMAYYAFGPIGLGVLALFYLLKKG